MTPSQAIVQGTRKTFSAVDHNGRKFVLRHLTALDTLRLFKAAGPVLAQNEPWLSMAGLALSVIEVDGIPVPQPTTEAQIEALVDRLGDLGLSAIADVVKDEQAQETVNSKLNVGN